MRCRSAAVAAVVGACISVPAIRAQDVTFMIDAVHDRHAIPESVYGVNDGSSPGATVHRHGGNRHTGLNWENNASNAGTDYLNSSDSFLGSEAGIGDSQTPGALLEAWINADRAAGLKTMITLPVAGYVAADMNGPVSQAETAPSARWKQVVVNKSSAPSLNPDTNDGVVYLSEMVNYLLVKFGSAANGGVAAYSLDNEPALWPSTHPRIHPNATTYQELASKDAAVASMVTQVDPTAEVYGPVGYGWNEHLNLQDAPDSSQFNATYGTFTNFYLAQMKSASDAAGRRLLHRYDMHWYPEAQGDNRIVFGSGPGTSADIDARLQAPRSLWDAQYVEKSWITQYTTNGQGIRLLPRLQESVSSYFPGTGLAITEYNYGGTDHISGAAAEADVLGIFGEYETAACFWPLTDSNSYVNAAFQLYRNYDGAGSKFGNTSLSATASDDAKAAVHAARAGDKLTVVAVSRSQTASETAQFQFALNNGEAIAAIRAFRISSGGGAAVEQMAAPPFSASHFTDTVPPMSSTLYEVQISGAAATPSRLGNLSTRLRVENGDNVLIGGFIVIGSQPKKVLVRALGPSLPVAGALADPKLDLYNGNALIASNDDWADSEDKQAIVDSTIAPPSNKEAAILATLPANGSSYTAIVTGASRATGVGQVEIYDLDSKGDSKLANISTRGFVQTGDNVMIGGVIVVGQSSEKVLVRAIGPSTGVAGALADPTLELRDKDGNLLQANDNWKTDQEAEIEATSIPPNSELESALVRTLAAGNYTAIVRGANGSTGVALVEVYGLD